MESNGRISMRKGKKLKGNEHYCLYDGYFDCSLLNFIDLSIFMNIAD